MEADNKELISPLTEDAFSEPVLHRVVLSNIDFELPDEIWYEINEGFLFIGMKKSDLVMMSISTVLVNPYKNT